MVVINLGEEIMCNRSSYISKQKVKEQLDYWIGSLDDDWVIRNIKKELGLEDD